MAEFEGRVAVVTGAGPGIGRSAAEACARPGAAVAVPEVDRARHASFLTGTCYAAAGGRPAR